MRSKFMAIFSRAGRHPTAVSATSMRPALAAIDSLLAVAASQPVIGPFVQVLQLAIRVCETMIMNAENAERFKNTLSNAADITDEAIRVAESEGSPVQMDIVKKFAADLTKILQGAVNALDTFTRKGCLRKVIAGQSPSDIFQEYDNMLIRKFNELNLALNMSQQKLLEQVYTKVEGLEQWCHNNGGLESLLDNQVKLQELANMIGAKVDVVHEEIAYSIEELREMQEKMVEKQDVMLGTILERFEAVMKRFDDLEISSAPALAPSLSATAASALVKRQLTAPGDGDVVSEMYPAIEWGGLAISREDVLGQGGFAVVYRGMYKGRPVAVKELKFAAVGLIDESTLTGLRREVASLAAVAGHPFVIQLLGANLNMQDSSHPLCLVLELAEKSLHDAIHTSHKSTFDRTLLNKVHIMLGVAKAMAFVCEKCNIVFRDLKPMNILLVNNEPKLADFGLAKRDVDVTSRDSIESAKGTPAYMAPEVFQYAHRNMKMDVYSFGVVLNEVLTETIPFASYNKFQISHAVMTGERPEVFKSSTAASVADSTSLRTLVSHETESIALTRIVMACWQGEPSLRPTFSNLVSDLTKVATSLLDSVKFGNTSSILREEIQLEAVAAKPLASVTVDEVVNLFKNLNLANCESVIRRELIDGMTLNEITSMDQVKEFELPLKDTKAKVLLRHLDEFRDRGGVADSLLKEPPPTQAPVSTDEQPISGAVDQPQEPTAPAIAAATAAVVKVKGKRSSAGDKEELKNPSTATTEEPKKPAAATVKEKPNKKPNPATTNEPNKPNPVPSGFVNGDSSTESKPVEKENSQKTSPRGKDKDSPAKSSKSVEKEETNKKKARNANPYNMFYAEKFPEVKAQNPGAKLGQLSPIIASMWAALDDEGKDPYIKAAAAKKSEDAHT